MATPPVLSSAPVLPAEQARPWAESVAGELRAGRREITRRGWVGKKSGLFEHPVRYTLFSWHVPIGFRAERHCISCSLLINPASYQHLKSLPRPRKLRSR